MPSSGRYRAMVRGGSDLRQRLSPAFEAPHFAAAAREVDDCFDTAEGALALMGRLDRVSEEQLRQHPAHVRHRQARAALCPDCRRSWSRRADRTRAPGVLLSSFEHSEDLEDENCALRLCHASLDAEAIRYAHIHQDIITARFGRFPHRNPGFGRDMTPEEQAFLEEGGFAG
jgi:uncharacterized protein (DUF924 family)